MGFETVLTFGTRAASTPQLLRGVLRRVDDTIHQAEMLVRDDDDTVLVHLQRRDCVDALVEIVATDDGVARIECDVETTTHRAVALHLSIDAERLHARMREGGGVPCEEHLVNLARAVWREARVPVPSIDARGDYTEEDEAPSPPAWRTMWRLFPHQRRTLRWMRELEARVPCPLFYSGNLRVTDKWYIDTERECLSTDPSPREAHVCGGVCANDPGTGKTAIVLRLVVEDVTRTSPPSTTVATTGVGYASGATLVILPLNLISQWTSEISKFLETDRVRVRTLVRAQDLRGLTLRELCSGVDLVLTTFYFLRSCRGYVDMVDAALGDRPRTRATLTAWARQPNHTEPVLEAVHWRRVVVDEVHETLESVRDVRLLRLFRYDALWGLSGTPILDTEQAQALYTLLEREKAHHPNLLATLISRAVRCDCDATDASERVARTSRHLKLVTLSTEERMHVAEAGATDVEAEVRMTSFVDAVAQSDAVRDLDEHFRVARARERAAIEARVAGHARAATILAETLAGFETALAEADEGDYVTRHAHDATMRELEQHRSQARSEAERLRALDEATARLDQRLQTIGLCVVCGVAECTSVPACGHAMCPTCTAANGKRCSVCRAVVVGARELRGVGTKMHDIGQLLIARAHESVILFVQWKSMMRGVRNFLRGLGVQVLHLDGNASHRTATLTEFMGGGVLLLCMEECFAGLHLPHARAVVFAHALVGDAATVERLERQAIARCVRHGQEGEEVAVYSFVVAEGAEEGLWRETHD